MKKRLINYYPGDLRNLLLEGVRQVSRRRKQVINTGPTNRTSYGKSDDCPKGRRATLAI